MQNTPTFLDFGLEFATISAKILAVNHTMQKKNLLNTNPYLSDPILCEALIIRTSATSSAIEGVTASAFKKISLPRPRKVKVSKLSKRSAQAPR